MGTSPLCAVDSAGIGVVGLAFVGMVFPRDTIYRGAKLFIQEIRYMLSRV